MLVDLMINATICLVLAYSSRRMRLPRFSFGSSREGGELIDKGRLLGTRLLSAFEHIHPNVVPQFNKYSRTVTTGALINTMSVNMRSDEKTAGP